MLESVDKADSKSVAERREGSSPSGSTMRAGLSVGVKSGSIPCELDGSTPDSARCNITHKWGLLADVPSVEAGRVQDR